MVMEARATCRARCVGESASRSRSARVVAARAVAGTPPTPLAEAARDKVVLVGAGIAGLACACALKRANVPCLVVERASSRREGGAAIALWKNAWSALDHLLGKLGSQSVRESHPSLSQIELCSPSGVLKSLSLDECDGPKPHEFRGCWRSEVLEALEANLDAETDVRYGVDVVGASPSNGGGGVVLRTASGENIECRAVVGCDGVGSRIARESLGLETPAFAGYAAVRGVARFEDKIPPSLPRNVVRQILGRGVRAGLYPVSDSEVYWFVCFNAEEAFAREWGQDKEGLLRIVADWEGAIQDVIQATPRDEMVASSISDRWVAPWELKSREGGAITLAGDGLHPMTPNLGQGGCCALEDAVVLSQMVEDHPGDLALAFRKYEEKRALR